MRAGRRGWCDPEAPGARDQRSPPDGDRDRIIPNRGPDDAVVRALRARLRGRLLRPGDAGYDDARRVWNGRIDRSPALIARCAGAGDVTAAVRFAREHGLSRSVNGGGHGVAGRAVCAGGLTIDCGPLLGSTVNPDRRTARAGGGVTWGVFDRATPVHGLATTGGVIPSTGIAGLTLGGGIGFLMRHHGLSCDNLTAAKIVTADGDHSTEGCQGYCEPIDACLQSPALRGLDVWSLVQQPGFGRSARSAGQVARVARRVDR